MSGAKALLLLALMAVGTVLVFLGLYYSPFNYPALPGFDWQWFLSMIAMVAGFVLCYTALHFMTND